MASASDSADIQEKANAMKTGDNSDRYLDEIAESLAVLKASDLLQALEMLFLVPLELHRLQHHHQLEDLHYEAKFRFIVHQYRCKAEAELRTLQI